LAYGRITFDRSGMITESITSDNLAKARFGNHGKRIVA